MRELYMLWIYVHNCGYPGSGVNGLLEANRMPTGLLLDYAFDFTEPKIFNGIVPNGVSTAGATVKGGPRRILSATVSLPTHNGSS